MKKTISHYKLVKELGRGAMATVYKAVDITSQRAVALKVLFPHLSSDEIIRKRFLREAKAGMELSHPGIVKVYEVGEEEKQSFIAMELMKGKTLDKVFHEETLDVERIIDIGRQVADALAAAHKKGIIHRDIKPKNIMVSNGSVKVMDFGLARIRDTSTLTEKHEIVGTLYYMSPQQAIGAQIDAQSDIFSLGVVLYQLLTSTLPFEGDHPGAIIHAILHSDPLRMEEIREGIPVEVEQVVFKALQKKPQERYQSALEFKSDLEKVKEILKGKNVTLIATEEVFEESVRGIYSALVGREHEMEMLEEYLERMLKGRGGTIFVKGEAGIGKSRLVWELGRKTKKKKVRYMVGRCISGGEELPYLPILEIMRSYLELKGVKGPESLGDFIEEKANHLMGRIEVIQALLFVSEKKEPSLINKEQLWDTVTELVKVMSEDRPILIHLEDLHWADLATLNLLHYLSRNSRQNQVLIVGTYRPEELIEELGAQPHPLSALLKKMCREELYEEMSIERLDSKETQHVICSIFQHSDFPERFVNLIYDETEGNPLFILETLKLLRNEGVITQKDGGWKLSSEIHRIAIPKRVNDVIMNRLSSLTRKERNLVNVASVEGRSFQSDTLCHCLRLPRIKVLLGLQGLEHSHHLIHASEREYHFDHGKIREVIYDSLIPELKREYHRLIGEYFRKNFGEDEEYAGKIAHHLLKADGEKEALPYLIKAGEHAKKLFANEETIGYFDKGIELVDRCLEQHFTTDLQRIKLILFKGRAEVKGLIGCYDEAREDYENIEQFAHGLGDQNDRAYGLNGVGEIMYKQGNYEKALNYYDQALRIRKQIGDKRGENMTLNNIGIVHYDRGNYSKALSYLEQALRICRQIGDKRGEGNTLIAIGNVHTLCGDYEPALSYYDQALNIERQIRNKQGEGTTLNSVGIVHYHSGDYELALSDLEQALEILGQVGDKRGEASTLNNIGLLHWNRGDYKLALSYYEQAMKIWRQIGDKRGEGASLGNIGIIYYHSGDYELALSYFEQAMKVWRQIGDMLGEGHCLHNIGNIHWSRGDYELALGYLERALKIGRQIGDKRGEAGTINNIGLFNWSRGDYEVALNYYEQALRIYRQIGDKRGQWESHHYLCELHLDLGDSKKALEELKEAGKIAEAIGTRKMSAWLKIDEALMKFLRGSYDDARLDIQKGLEIARELKEIDAIMEGLIVAARVEIARSNRSKDSEYVEEVLSLAMDKGRKRDVAQASLLLACIHLSKGDLSEAVSHATQAQKIAEASRMKELTWQAHYWLGKVYSKKKKYSSAYKELGRAEKIVNTISSKLNKELRKTYLAKTKIKGFYKDLKIIKAKSKPRRKS